MCSEGVVIVSERRRETTEESGGAARGEENDIWLVVPRTEVAFQAPVPVHCDVITEGF